MQLPLKKGEHTTVLVAVSGGKDSAVLLDAIVDLIGKRRDVTIVAGTVDEGIEGYRPPSIECAASLCDRLGVEHHVVTYPELSFLEMDEVVQRLPAVVEKDKDAPRMACSYCGVFRRQGINHLAERVGADVIALGHNLDDMAQTVLMNMANADLERTLRLAPHTATPVDGLAPRIVPLRWVPEQEIHLYALHRDLPMHHEECPNARGALRWRHREMVAHMEADVPGTRHGLVRMADQIKSLRDQVVRLGGGKPATSSAHALSTVRGAKLRCAVQSLRHARSLGCRAVLEDVLRQLIQILGSAAVVASQLQRRSSHDFQSVSQRFTGVGGDAV